MIDLLKASIVNRLDNAACIASRRNTCIACIDEQRLTGRSSD